MLPVIILTYAIAKRLKIAKFKQCYFKNIIQNKQCWKINSIDWKEIFGFNNKTNGRNNGVHNEL